MFVVLRQQFQKGCNYFSVTKNISFTTTPSTTLRKSWLCSKGSISVFANKQSLTILFGHYSSNINQNQSINQSDLWLLFLYLYYLEIILFILNFRWTTIYWINNLWMNQCLNIVNSFERMTHNVTTSVGGNKLQIMWVIRLHFSK